ncbi:MAG: DnaJ domain-containing protein [Acidimicrobiales bacterium]|nr:DnaJ domain-containing protein [Acidimicrobiales bacterium]
MNHYATLGINPEADYETIRQAWVAAARMNHPDALVDATDEQRRRAELKMRAINEAWRVLGSDKLKISYDEELHQTKDSPIEVEETWSEDWFDLEASDPPGFEVGNAVVATVLRGLPWLVIGAIGVGIFVFSAFATNSRPERWQRPVSEKECVVVREDGTLRGGARCEEMGARQVIKTFPMDADDQCPLDTDKFDYKMTDPPEYWCLAQMSSVVGD